MKLTLLEINTMNGAVKELLDETLPTAFVFRLVKLQKQLTEPLQIALETIQKKMGDGLTEEQANVEVLSEEVELDIEKIPSSLFPNEIKGSIIQRLINIIDLEGGD